MMNNMLLFLVLFQLHLAVCVDLSSLRLVNVVFRHGDRSPVSIFPKDVNQIDSWPDGLGWLSSQFYKLVGKESGWSHENISNIWRVADTLFCEKEHGLKPNPWADKIAPSPNKDNLTVYEKLRKLDDWQFGLMYQGKQLSKLKEHDTTVAALLSTLGLFNQLSPPYAAMDIIELHQNSEGYYVNILYKNETDKAYNLTVPGCQKDCMFTDFIKLTKDVIPTDWEAECGLPSNSTTVIVSIILGGILFLLLVTLVITCFHYQRKRGVTYNKWGLFCEDFQFIVGWGLFKIDFQFIVYLEFTLGLIFDIFSVYFGVNFGQFFRFYKGNDEKSIS
ncbi:hypothetical protein KUTeg_008283 [Tegillarca granosa]|uniref:acid phosphatase n=1 Tax=Tegillarca granosa TaxID=220873 RepID=A0ABQ9FCZ4_TEGGR|nr:hypothetical protein KUTeg_008283 [Tegillarca granosa]